MAYLGGERSLMNPAHAERNRAATSRLRALVDRLAPTDLETPLGDDWTVKVALVHMAFWDRLAASFLNEWRHAGVQAMLTHGEDLHLNRVCLGDWLAVPAAYAVQEVLDAAHRIDELAAQLDEPLHSAIIAAGEAFACERFSHRTEHLLQMEQALSRRR